ncbi:hypothetical protein PI23P_08240 [Polaribacter irgensii 23-P]|uniref:Uncharacterized protein n=1 Tax=Polaribacter irgensii 23-P TaxID=313594 RepID=A4BZK7_9FLAO|nr:hypothetical protein PI23P_08240 [Polaribacter irgensii 23-P]
MHSHSEKLKWNFNALAQVFRNKIKYKKIARSRLPARIFTDFLFRLYLLNYVFNHASFNTNTQDAMKIKRSNANFLEQKRVFN